MIYVGCDPEIFLKDENGSPVSAISRFGGTKKKPKIVSELVMHNTRLGKFAIQEDNVALEYNIPPSASNSHWIKYHRLINDYLDKAISSQGLQKHIVPAVSFPDEQLNTPKAWIFGCDPDFDAWELKINPRPTCDDKNLRSAGGHVHVGYDSPNKIKSIEMVRNLDLHITLPMLLVEPPNERTKLYGGPGAMRFKPYGFEYRTPSNFWVTNEARIAWIFKAVIHSITNKLNVNEVDLPHLIRTRDMTEISRIVDKYGVIPCPQ
jgi:hypothetical protein